MKPRTFILVTALLLLILDLWSTLSDCYDIVDSHLIRTYCEGLPL
jgi:hypothetical protein